MILVSVGRDLDRLRSEMSELLSHRWQSRRLGGRRGFEPAVDVVRVDEPPFLTVLCELAGVETADIQLSLTSGVLTIAGVRRRPAIGPGSITRSSSTGASSSGRSPSARTSTPTTPRPLSSGLHGATSAGTPTSSHCPGCDRDRTDTVTHRFSAPGQGS